MKDRIKKIIESEDLSAAKFADRLEINRAVVSHILNGRNNPSLDVVTKILSEMNYINPDWLLSGNGEMYKDGYGTASKNERNIFDTEPVNAAHSAEAEKYATENTSKNHDLRANTAEIQGVPPIALNDRKVRQIIVYYDDNTFETFTPH